MPQSFAPCTPKCTTFIRKLQLLPDDDDGDDHKIFDISSHLDVYNCNKFLPARLPLHNNNNSNNNKNNNNVCKKLEMV
jgi:hypothetical protein